MTERPPPRTYQIPNNRANSSTGHPKVPLGRFNFFFQARRCLCGTPQLGLGAVRLQSVGQLLVCRSIAKVLSLAGALSRAAEIGVEQGGRPTLPVSEKEVTVSGILASMSAAMSWSGFVTLIHNHRKLQGSFTVSL